jgi:RNA polymerase sigma factor (sigma-70 family)
MQPDSRLIALTRAGHDAGFEELLRRYRGALVAFAAGIAGANRAEDVVQEALARAHAAILRDGAEIAAKPWLYAIVRNRALNDLRDEPRHEHLDESYDGVPQPPAVAEDRARFAGLVAGIQALPAAQREALVKRELEGRGHGEIAAQMGLTPGAVRQLIFRARTTLRDGLGLLIPGPVLRFLAEDAGTRVAAAGAGAAAGTGGALALKAGVVTLVGGLAIGGGIALERGGGELPRAEIAVAEDREGTSQPAHGSGQGEGTDAAGSSSAAGSGDSGSDPPDSGEDLSGSGNSGPGSSSSGPGGPGGEEAEHEGGHSGHGGGEHEAGDDHSGPGDGGDVGEGDHSGPGGGDDGSSGPGGGEEPDEPDGPTEPEEPTDGNSGPGGEEPEPDGALDFEPE